MILGKGISSEIFVVKLKTSRGMCIVNRNIYNNIIINSHICVYEIQKIESTAFYCRLFDFSKILFPKLTINDKLITSFQLLQYISVLFSHH